ncbi:MAG: response regulator [Candidatus Microgenomates bacterium]|jgi:two-component system alkaline phosphatase synthesis response regulator PhoP
MKKILIVEDDVALQGVLVHKLTQEGFAVISAKNGQEGLDLALADHPDLILLDIIMPVMDGMTMFRKLRTENEWGKAVKVIILTNLNSDSDQIINDVTVLEPSYYLVKADWKLEDLVIKVKEVLVPPAEVQAQIS